MERIYRAAAVESAVMPPGAVAGVCAAVARTARRLGVVKPVQGMSLGQLRQLVRDLHASLGDLSAPLPDLERLPRAELRALVSQLRAAGKRGRA